MKNTSVGMWRQVAL